MLFTLLKYADQGVIEVIKHGLPLLLIVICIRILRWYFTKDYNKALLEAAENGNLEGIKEALKYDANIEYKDKKGINALIFACVNGHKDAVFYLINQAKAKVNVEDNNRGEL